MPNDKQKVKDTVSKKKSRIGKITSVALGVLVGLLVVLQIVGQATAKNNYGVMRYGNYQALRVLTDSMEPTYKVDTMVIIKRVDPKTLKGPTSEGALDGDVITFMRNWHGSYETPSSDYLRKIVTHRIMKVEPQPDGSVYFRTLGDNTNATECPASGCTLALNGDWVRDTDILGKVVGKSMVVGKFSKLLGNPIFMFVFAMIPLFLVFGSSLADLLKQLKHTNASEAEHGKIEGYDADFQSIKEQEKLRLLIELEKEKLKKELEEEKQDVDI
ncbi:MAG: hypothetical protein ACOX3C_04150 [Bacilli bacterium]|jgi:signal peptidase I